MSARRSVGRIASAAAMLLGFGGCSDKSDGSEPAAGAPSAVGGSVSSSSGAGGASSSGATGVGGSGMPSGSGGGSVVVGISGSPGSGGAATCAGDTTSAKQVPLDIYLMLDSSGSMTELTTSTSDKWTDVLKALGTFVRDPGSEGIGLGLQYFPITDPSIPNSCASDADCGANNACVKEICLNVLIDANVALPCTTDADCNYDTTLEPQCGPIGECVADDALCLPEFPEETCSTGVCPQFTSCLRYSSCDVGTYGTPAVPITTLPGAIQALNDSLSAKVPDGKTPTAPALSGAIQHAREWSLAHPDHKVVTLLATDGWPTECFAVDEPTDAQAIAEVTAIAQSGLQQGIQTFVIGVFSPDDIALGARMNMDQIAVAGGTEHAFVVDSSQDVTAQFLDALSAIRGDRLGCEFQVPSSDQGKDVDFDRVNVDFTSSGTTTRIPRVNGQSACDPTRGGWYYDVDPTAGDPQRIIVCPKSCSDFASAEDASVLIELGCLSEIIE